MEMDDSLNLKKKTLKVHQPVFPDVGSMSVLPGFSIPFCSASSTIRSPILSFTEPPALKYSHFATAKMEDV